MTENDAIGNINGVEYTISNNIIKKMRDLYGINAIEEMEAALKLLEKKPTKEVKDAN